MEINKFFKIYNGNIIPIFKFLTIDLLIAFILFSSLGWLANYLFLSFPNRLGFMIAIVLMYLQYFFVLPIFLFYFPQKQIYYLTIHGKEKFFVDDFSRVFKFSIIVLTNYIILTWIKNFFDYFLIDFLILSIFLPIYFNFMVKEKIKFEKKEIKKGFIQSLILFLFLSPYYYLNNLLYLLLFYFILYPLFSIISWNLILRRRK